MIDTKDSPVDKVIYNDRKIYIKRDDLLDSEFSGNKARKFHYFLVNDFPRIKRVVSYGSNQSNAMYSLSVLCKIKGWDFIYFTDHLSAHLQDNPIGNLKHALQNGMELKLFSQCPYKELKQKNLLSKTIIKKDTLFIPEGGRCETSRYGIEILAKEIAQFKSKKHIKKLYLFLPSGTGTTALYLNQALKKAYQDIEVFTNACVGGEEYLKKQFFALQKNKKYHPVILKTKKHRFGGLDCKMYKFWIELQKNLGIEFDLLYDPYGFWYMLEYIKKFNPTAQVMYIHQGGIKGNVSMLLRYKRKCSEDI